MKFVKMNSELWEKLSRSKEVQLAGASEKVFLENVYRICYVLGLAKGEESISYRMYAGVLKVLSLALFCCELLYPFSVNLSLIELISYCNIIIIHCMTIWKYKSMIDHSELYKKLAKCMDTTYFDITTEGRKKIMAYWAETHDKYLKVLLKLGTCTITVWNIFPFIDDDEYNLSMYAYVPFTFDTPTRYFLTYLLYGTTFVYASFWVVLSECIMQAYLYSFICQYAVLADCFENIIKDCANLPEFEGMDHERLVRNEAFAKKYFERLGILIQQHKNILNNTMDMKAILSSPMLGQLIVSGLLICLVAYQATATIADNTGKFLMSLLYLGYVMFTLFLVCKSCEEITTQSNNIGSAAYFSGWESGMSVVPGVQSAMMMIILRANKPLVFLAGGMYTLSLQSYTNLVKASYSAFTMLLRTNK